MKAISDETIESAVDHMFVERILGFNEIDIYRATSGIPKEGLKSLSVADHLILEWIRNIIDDKNKRLTLENKIKVIKEIFNSMDKYMGGNVNEEKI
ncbi:hypothetical protein [Clostridium tyrobutyricum]|uniref:hypothetical protein n=1 Tax=Clostridium tyrobutyricum TaxID=1519 RepID=UPI000AA2089A|nr:hypothetical protein [Clostridium tyrobutyricum]